MSGMFGLGAVLGVSLLLAVAFTTVAGQADGGEHADGLPAVWFARIGVVEQAIAAGDGVRAARTWPDVWSAALASRRWDALLAAGDTARRIGELTGATSARYVNTRQAYRAALFRAYSQRSVDGVLRAAEAMALMGDRQMCEVALSMARKLAAASWDQEVRARVERDARRIGAISAAAVSRGRAR